MSFTAVSVWTQGWGYGSWAHAAHGWGGVVFGEPSVFIPEEELYAGVPGVLVRAESPTISSIVRLTEAVIEEAYRTGVLSSARPVISSLTITEQDLLELPTHPLLTLQRFTPPTISSILVEERESSDSKVRYSASKKAPRIVLATRTSSSTDTRPKTRSGASVKRPKIKSVKKRS